MGQIRVNRADLRMRLPGGARKAADGLRRRAEGPFLTALLQGLHDEVERRFGPDAVLFVRSLALRISPRMAEFRGDALARQIGRDLARGLQPVRPGAQGVRARTAFAEAEAALFDTPAAALAHRLAAALRGHPGPLGPPEPPRTVFADLAQRSPELQSRAARRLAPDPGIEDALRALPANEVGGLKAFVAAIRSSGDPGDPAAKVKGRDVEQPAPPEDAPTTESSRSASEVQHGPTARRRDQRPDEEPPVPASTDAKGQPEEPDQSESTRSDDTAEEPAIVGDPLLPSAIPSTRHTEASRDGPPRAPPESDTSTPDAPDRVTPTEHQPSASLAERAAETPWCRSTSWGGLAYLLNLSQRLGLPERLWRIGVDEGQVIAAMFARISDSADAPDPICATMWPAAPPAPWPIVLVPDWARAEIVGGMMGNAAAMGPPDLAERIAARMAVWEDPGGWSLPCWLAALHLSLFETLTAQDDPEAARAALALRGTLVQGADALRLILPMEAVDIDIRRAGLDLSPGYLGWLDTRLSIDFEDDILREAPS